MAISKFIFQLFGVSGVSLEMSTCRAATDLGNFAGARVDMFVESDKIQLFRLRMVWISWVVPKI